LIFFDPLRHFEADGRDFRRRIDSDPAEINAERGDAWNAIDHAITLRRNQVWNRVAEIEESFHKIQEGHGLNQEEEDLVGGAKLRIAEFRHVTVANADRFVELFRSNWVGPNSRHHMTLRATNNRFGLYPPRVVDIYYDAVPITERLVRAATSHHKAKLIGIVEQVRGGSAAGSDLRELFSVLQTRIDSSFEEMIRQVGGEMQAFLQNNAFYPRDQTNQFWLDVQARYGAGPGFRDDVLSMYADQMGGLEDVLEEKADESWQRIVIDPILQYLG
jgi:hypothetical protein